MAEITIANGSNEVDAKVQAIGKAVERMVKRVDEMAEELEEVNVGEFVHIVRRFVIEPIAEDLAGLPVAWDAKPDDIQQMRIAEMREQLLKILEIQRPLKALFQDTHEEVK